MASTDVNKQQKPGKLFTFLIINLMRDEDLMEQLIDHYKKGQYQQCLNFLKELSFKDLSAVDFLIVENNRIVCESLMCITIGESIYKDINGCIELWNNCIATGLHNETVPLQIELAFVFNIIWLTLAASESIAPNSEKLENVLRVLSVSCSRITGESVSAPTSVNTIEDSLMQLTLLRDNVIKKHSTSSGICLEITVSAILIFLPLVNCSDTYNKVAEFIKDTLQDSRELKALALSSQESPYDHRSIFKFGFHFGNSNLAEVDCENAIHLLSLLGNFCTVKYPKCHNYELFHVTRQPKWACFMSYCQALRSFRENDMDRTLGLILGNLSNVEQVDLQGRHYSLLGQVYSHLGEHQKAVESLAKASRLLRNVATVYYYLGLEYGKMGLHDLMLRSYENLLKVVKKNSSSTRQSFILDIYLLEMLHDPAEITKSEAIYLLSSAYALNERFEEAMNGFDKLMNPKHYSTLIKSSREQRIVKIPQIIVILHETAAMYILNGNLTRAEELCRQALGTYLATEKSDQINFKTDVHGTKDKDWFRAFLVDELKVNASEISEPKTYYEDYVSFFDEDVIGLMLLAEIHRIQQLEEARITLNQTLLVLSKHIARMQKETKISDEEQFKLNLVKALTCKICLHIAELQEKTKPFQDVDRMFKRALSCNNGDQDVLHSYAQFLVREEKVADAGKLWKTFSGKVTIVNVEECQSLALRYLLKTEVSMRQLQNLAVALGVNR